ncbi:unnamed protein product [Tilletia controversa]|uniref:UBX domain-containing protein n=1 Tax=Tilletia controversa TaxID=13291 RepID=A0A8X7SYZ7_9BASI|nr:hypothetical protein A4X06_0g2225 [Tilletia controversa]CAD6913270.1 unnamed protein product [Tilletia controversa]CAD6942868.1 unnamed protein product [Tilletia controversa]CAD6967837.1 unnamed protein product [Tilletia controversa]CAD6980693.1 unnamed protein product [Tilletia controversa]
MSSSQPDAETPAASSSSSSSSSAPAAAVKVFRPANATAGPSRASQLLSKPEENAPSSSELKQAFAGAIAGRHGPDAPLMTKAMRERQDAKYGTTKKVYTTVRLRIRFSNGTQIESAFPASSPLPPVYDFVRSSLAPAHAPKKFTLYLTPPKRDLGELDPKLRGKTLGELGLVPAAVLNIRWEDTEMNSNTCPAPLKPELLNDAQDIPPPPSFDEPSSSQTPSSSSSSSTAQGDGAKKDPKAMPKWLKAGFKK